LCETSGCFLFASNSGSKKRELTGGTKAPDSQQKAFFYMQNVFAEKGHVCAGK